MKLDKIMRDAWRALLRHRLRSFLSSLGIVFAVVAVVSMLSIAEGAKQETLELLEVTGLAEHVDRVAGNLSQGDKKRLELAIALGSKPELLFLDEPTAGMSGEETHETMSLVKRLNRKMRLTILFTEHDMSVVFGYARRLTVLHQGSILAEGSPEEVRSNETAQKIYLGEEA